MFPSPLLPPPPSPDDDLPKAKRQIPREHSLTMLRNNIVAVFAILFFNWFFAIYTRVELLVPASWLRTVHIMEIGLLCVVFGSNILIALISLCYPCAPHSDPAPKTPLKSKSPIRSTPVRRPVKNLGTSKYHVSGSAPSESRLINNSINSPLESVLSLSQSEVFASSINSTDSLPLAAAYRSRHPRRPSEPIGTGLLKDFMTENTKFTGEMFSAS